MTLMFAVGAGSAYGQRDKIAWAGIDTVAGILEPMARRSAALRKPVPGPLFAWVKRYSWVELAIFSALVFFWLAPGFDEATKVFGWAHGIGYIGLCLLIWAACLKREAPYTLLAASLTPVGPLGSVIAIELIERKGWGIARAEEGAAPEAA